MAKVNVTTARMINNKRNLLKIGNLLIESFEGDVVMVTEHISGDHFSGVVIQQAGGEEVTGTHCTKLFINRFEQYYGTIAIEVK